MNRRDFVAGFGKMAGVAGGAATAAAAVAYPRTRDTAVATARRLQKEMKKLDARIDAMDKTQPTHGQGPDRRGGHVHGPRCDHLDEGRYPLDRPADPIGAAPSIEKPARTQ